EAAFADASRDGSTRYSRAGRHRTKDNRVIEVTLEITQIELAGRLVALAIVTDVTGIQQAERRLRLLVEHSADGIVLTDTDHVIRYVSPGGQNILGYRADEVIGTVATKRAHPDEVARGWDVPAPGETRSVVSRVSHRDGSWRWVEAST